MIVSKWFPLSSHPLHTIKCIMLCIVYRRSGVLIIVAPAVCNYVSIYNNILMMKWLCCRTDEYKIQQVKNFYTHTIQLFKSLEANFCSVSSSSSSTFRTHGIANTHRFSSSCSVLLLMCNRFFWLYKMQQFIRFSWVVATLSFRNTFK